MGSTRLPGKVLQPAAGRPLLALMLERVRAFDAVDEVVVATTVLERDDVIAQLASDAGFAVYRGSEDDVLDRFRGAAEQAGAGTVVRLTSDCPLMVGEAIDAVLDGLAGGADLATNAPPEGRTWPDGLDAEAFSREALDRLAATTTDQADREHVTRGFHLGADWTVREVHLPRDLGDVRITVDTAEDLELVRALLEELIEAHGLTFGLADVLAALERRGLAPAEA